MSSVSVAAGSAGVVAAGGTVEVVPGRRIASDGAHARHVPAHDGHGIVICEAVCGLATSASKEANAKDVKSVVC